MEIIFFAKSKYASAILKTLVEIISQVSSTTDACLNSDSSTDNTVKHMKQACIKISKENIQIYSENTKNVFIRAVINKETFEEYNYSGQPLTIGISMDILKTCFKNIHKLDELKIRIEKDSYSSFPNIISFILNDTKGFCIKFNIAQNIMMSDYTEYKDIINIPSSKFSNLYKEIGGVKKKVVLTLKDGYLKLATNIVDIATNWVNISTQSKFIPEKETLVKSECFKTAARISTLDSCVKLLINLKGDLLFKSNIVRDNKIVGTVYFNINNLNV